MPEWLLVLIGVALALALVAAAIACSLRAEFRRKSRLPKPSDREDTGPSVPSGISGS